MGANTQRGGKIARILRRNVPPPDETADSRYHHADVIESELAAIERERALLLERRRALAALRGPLAARAHRLQLQQRIGRPGRYRWVDALFRRAAGLTAEIQEVDRQLGELAVREERLRAAHQWEALARRWGR